MKTDSALQKVLLLLNNSDVSYTIHDYGEKSVVDIQGDLPFPIEALVKTLVFRVNENWILAAMKAQDRLDYRRLADACGVARSAISTPSPEEVEASLGVEVGGVPPLPLHKQVRVLFDQHVLDSEVVYCGAGQPGMTLEIRATDLLNLAGGKVSTIAREKV